MLRHIKYLTIFIAALLLILIFLPFPAQAQSFSVSPAEVEIDNLSPGGEVQFNLTIHNKDNVSHTFTLTTYNPEELQRREGKAHFPDASWVSFPQQVEVQANSASVVKIKVAIPSEQKWVGRDWEIWLGAAPESSDSLTVKLYVRLLISTSGETKTSCNKWLIVGIVAGIALLMLGVYRLRKRAKAPKV